MTTESGQLVLGNQSATDQVPIPKIQLHASKPPRPSDWSGEFTLPPGRRAEIGRAQLVLSDGRRGEVVLYRLDAGPARTTLVKFWGIGPLKKVS